MELTILGSILIIGAIIAWVYIVHETKVIKKNRNQLKRIEVANLIMRTKLTCITGHANDEELAAYQALDKIKNCLNKD